MPLGVVAGVVGVVSVPPLRRLDATESNIITWNVNGLGALLKRTRPHVGSETIQKLLATNRPVILAILEHKLVGPTAGPDVSQRTRTSNAVYRETLEGIAEAEGYDVEWTWSERVGKDGLVVLIEKEFRRASVLNIIHGMPKSLNGSEVKSRNTTLIFPRPFSPCFRAHCLRVSGRIFSICHTFQLGPFVPSVTLCPFPPTDHTSHQFVFLNSFFPQFDMNV